jgi:hypothetical protein
MSPRQGSKPRRIDRLVVGCKGTLTFSLIVEELRVSCVDERTCGIGRWKPGTREETQPREDSASYSDSAVLTCSYEVQLYCDPINPVVNPRPVYSH